MTFPPFMFSNGPDDAFVAGETFWSRDGKTWVRGEPPPVVIDPTKPVTRVVSVDHGRGIITVDTNDR